MATIFDLPDDALVRLSAVIAPCGPVPISRATWYVWRKAGFAPQPIRLGANSVGYRVGDVKAFVRRNAHQS